MADHSLIEWTDATWNPITGCSVVSPGCTNCYAMRLAGTRLKHHPSRAGLTIDTKAGPVWNGKVRLNEQWLDQPLRWSKPRMIFVCAHGDLFHEGVPDGWIDRVFAVMALSPQHTFQILTKRADRMWSYVKRRHGTNDDVGVERACHEIMLANRRIPENMMRWQWPLPNVWLGVSAEDQRRASERVPLLLATPAKVRFLSAEPLLGHVDLRRLLVGTAPVEKYIDALEGRFYADHPLYDDLPRSRLDLVIVGGENGPRPMCPDWARSLRDQCASNGTAFFFKQWGSTLPAGQIMANGRTWAGNCALHYTMAPVGRLLDGIEHNDLPKVRP